MLEVPQTRLFLSDNDCDSQSIQVGEEGPHGRQREPWVSFYWAFF